MTKIPPADAKRAAIKFVCPSDTFAMGLDRTFMSWSHPGRIFYDVENVLYYTEERLTCASVHNALYDTMTEL